MSGIFWNDLKTEWKKVIQEMKARCRMVILIVHMRDEYKNNVRTGKRERRGKKTLSELATLEVELVRKPGQEVPSARVHKHRFFAGSLAAPTSVKPTLPSWMPECTWEVIRGYMANPVGEDILPPEEDNAEEREMEKLRLQAAIAEAELAKAEMQAASAIKATTAGAGKAPSSAAPCARGGCLEWQRRKWQQIIRQRPHQGHAQGAVLAQAARQDRRAGRRCHQPQGSPRRDRPGVGG